MAKFAVLFAIAALMVLSVTAVEEPKRCLCPTTDDIRYVCGSDGVSYVNFSTLRCAQKCKDAGITKVHEGKCAADAEKDAKESA